MHRHCCRPMPPFWSGRLPRRWQRSSTFRYAARPLGPGPLLGRPLPYLAWAFSVDRWDPTWSEAAKRSVIRSSYFVHRKKGTISALRRVVEPLGYLLEVTEWWQTQPPGPRGTFSLSIGVLDHGITEEMFIELERLITEAKPLTRHITGLDITLSTSLTAYVGVAINDGDELDVLPWESPDIDVTCHTRQALATTFHDTMDIHLHD